MSLVLKGSSKTSYFYLSKFSEKLSAELFTFKKKVLVLKTEITDHSLSSTIGSQEFENIMVFKYLYMIYIFKLICY